MAEFSPVVSPAWLEAHLQDPELLILDCRFALNDPAWGENQYRTAHIPGAYYLHLNRDLSGPVGRHGGRHPLPDPEKLAATLADLGLRPSRQVVAYDDSRLAFASRLWWLLRYLGHDRVGVLDQGFRAYQQAGYPVTTAIPAPQPGEFLPHLRRDWVVDRARVQACQDQPGVVLVDAREGDRYRGEREPIDPIAGHIPGAVNYPWQAVTDEAGSLRSAAELRSHWSDLAQAEEIIVYCGSGVTACVNLLGLAAAGFSNTKLYPGSWSDWCSYLG